MRIELEGTAGRSRPPSLALMTTAAVWLLVTACGPKKVRTEKFDPSDYSAEQATFIKGVTADYCETMFRCKAVAEIKKKYRLKHDATGEKMGGSIGLGRPTDDESIDQIYVWDRDSCVRYLRGRLESSMFEFNTARNPCSVESEPQRLVDSELPACRKSLRYTCDSFQWHAPSFNQPAFKLGELCPKAFLPPSSPAEI